MEVSQMNKTAILSFIIDEVALKARNASSNMRKRIHWMLKYMEITVAEYDERALILNGWIREGQWSIGIFEGEEIKKGLSNYGLKSQEQFDKVMSLNSEVRCSYLDFNPSAPIEVESINFLDIDQDNYEIYSKCTFTAANDVLLRNLSTDQIKSVLRRFKNIDKLEIYKFPLKSIDFSEFRIKRFDFNSVSFEEPIYLPIEIDELILSDCKSPNLVKAQRVNAITIYNLHDSPTEYEELAKTLKGVKVARINGSFTERLTSLPSTVREIFITGTHWKVNNYEEIVERFPYLIDFDSLFPIEVLDKTKFRAVTPLISQTEEKFILRPRKITVDDNNDLQLNNQPELFEKVESVDINTNKFNLDVLPTEIKRIKIWNEVDKESVTLSRLEKEPK